MGFNPDIEYDFDALIQDADNGDLDAMETVVSYMVFHNIQKDYPDKYISYLEALVANNITTGNIMLGEAYADGCFVEQDANKAIGLFNDAARKGCMFGYECIGMMYYEGNQVQQDYEKAFHYLKKIKGRKSFCTLFALGEMHRQGLFVSKNHRNACIYYRKIVNSKESYPEIDDYYWQACVRLGQAYHYGMGVKKDLDKAFDLMSKALTLYKTRGMNAVQHELSLIDLDSEIDLIQNEMGGQVQ